MKNSGNFLNFIFKIISMISDYSTIKQDEELRPKSKMFGTRSIILSSIGLFLITFFGVLTVRTLNNLNAGDLGVLISIFLLIILIVIDIYLIAYFLIMPLICWILQINLNKKPIGWIAMVVWILLFAISTGLIFLIPNML